MLNKVIPILITVLLIAICSPAWGQGGFGEADSNSDGKIDAKELKKYVANKLDGFDKIDAMFRALDKDGDTGISEDEFEDRMEVVRSLMRSRTDNAKRQQRRRRSQSQRDSGLKVGQEAPTFKLKSLDGKSETDLASFKGKKPVILIFGSYS